MSNKIYPIGIQNFEKIRKAGYFMLIRPHWSINWLGPAATIS